MRNNTEHTMAGKQYAAAHEVHYATKDLHEALSLYKGVMATHPGTPEAGYSREQIQNIVKSVVPEQELLDAQMKLASDILER